MLVRQPKFHVTLIEYRVLRLQSHDSYDREADLALGLQPAVAQGAVHRPVVQVPPRHDALVQADPVRKVRQDGAAGEQDRGPRVVVVGPGHRLPVGVDDVAREQQQRRARVRDGLEGLRDIPRVGVARYRRGADAVPRDREQPIDGRPVDGGVLDVARVTVTDEAEPVCPRDAALQVGGPHRQGQG